MAAPIIFVDTWTISDGRLEELKDAARAFVDFVFENEPRLIAYSVYVDENGSRSTVVQVHPDSESIELHMKVAGPQKSSKARTKGSTLASPRLAPST